jgi:hypothetical protein
MLTSRHVFRTLSASTVPPPLTADETDAVAHGWKLDTWRWLRGKLITPDAPVVRRDTGPLAASSTAIPPAPDLHSRVRAAAAARSGAGPHRPLVSVPAPGLHQDVAHTDTSRANRTGPIAPAPDLHARVRAAAGLDLASPTGDAIGLIGGVTSALRMVEPSFIALEDLDPDGAQAVYQVAGAAPASETALLQRRFSVDASGAVTLDATATPVTATTTYQRVAAAPRSSVSSTEIPPAPNLHDRVRAARQRPS